MRSSPLWQISVATSPEAEEAVAALLERLFKQTASIYVAAESGRSVVTIYASTLSVRVPSQRVVLRQELKQLGDCGLDVRPAKISVRKIPREDWAESWKRHFKPIDLGRALLIKPSWSQRRPGKNQATVIIDPGLSFGTGQHPTTLFCLNQLIASPNSGQHRSFLDIGTGSGILAIAAAKLGYSPVVAFDLDPVAVRVATANAQRNRVADRVSITRKDFSRLPLYCQRPYDVICANLISTVLVKESARILNRLKPGGRLILAGILANEFALLQREYETAGAKLMISKVEGGWRSGAFVRR